MQISLKEMKSIVYVFYNTENKNCQKHGSFREKKRKKTKSN